MFPAVRFFSVQEQVYKSRQNRKKCSCLNEEHFGDQFGLKLMAAFRAEFGIGFDLAAAFWTKLWTSWFWRSIIRAEFSRIDLAAYRAGPALSLLPLVLGRRRLGSHFGFQQIAGIHAACCHVHPHKAVDRSMCIIGCILHRLVLRIDH